MDTVSSGGYNQSSQGRKTATQKVNLSSQGKIRPPKNNGVKVQASGKQARPPTLLLAVDSSFKLALSVNNN